MTTKQNSLKSNLDTISASQMKTSKLEELKEEELRKKVKSSKAAVTITGFSVALMVLISIVGWLTYKEGFSGSMLAITIMPLFFMPILVMNIKRYRDLKTELHKRNLLD